MSPCWASSLGDCTEKLSREHVVSQALFLGEQVTVQGFPWCRNEAKKIGLSSLTAKILCRKHNSDLSQLDSAGARAFETLREMMRLSNVRAVLKPRRWTVERYLVDGPSLERWFLKTLINLAFEGEYCIGRHSPGAGQPSRPLVEISFGARKFEGHAGLYNVVHVGQHIQSDDTVIFAPLINEQRFISGGLFCFRGFRYFLSLEAESRPILPKGVGLPNEDWSISQMNFHNKEMRETSGKYLSQIIKTTWG